MTDRKYKIHAELSGEYISGQGETWYNRCEALGISIGPLIQEFFDSEKDETVIVREKNGIAIVLQIVKAKQ